MRSVSTSAASCGSTHATCDASCANHDAARAHWNAARTFGRGRNGRFARSAKPAGIDRGCGAYTSRVISRRSARPRARLAAGTNARGTGTRGARGERISTFTSCHKRQGQAGNDNAKSSHHAQHRRAIPVSLQLGPRQDFRQDPGPADGTSNPTCARTRGRPLFK
jgi:hypothetical protein